MIDYCIDGSAVRLRQWRDADLTTLQTLRNDSHLQAQVLTRASGSSIEQVRDWLSSRDTNMTARFYVVATREADDAVGYLQFMGLDSTDRRAELGICLSPSAQGRGFGTEAIALGLAHLKATHELRKCTLQVRSDNERAIRCYQRLGFEICGVLRRHILLEGVLWDVLLMEWLAE